MSDKNNKMWTKRFKTKIEKKPYEIVNERIDEAIGNELDVLKKKVILEELICDCESENNDASALATASIAYATVIGGCSAFFACADSNIPETITNVTIIGWTLIITGLALFGVAIRGNRVAMRRTLVLQALRFRYEKLSNETPSAAPDTGCTVEEREYIVKVKVKE